jgi:hypothetical protein
VSSATSRTGKILDDVLDEPSATRQVPVVGERGDERVAIVVVAGDEVHGHRERRQQRAQPRVFPGAAGVDQVAGRQHDVGPRLEAEQMLDGAGQVGRRVDCGRKPGRPRTGCACR